MRSEDQRDEKGMKSSWIVVIECDYYYDVKIVVILQVYFKKKRSKSLSGGRRFLVERPVCYEAGM